MIDAMTHPRRYEPDDEYLARLRTICLALPEAAEKDAQAERGVPAIIQAVPAAPRPL